jgi:hypothetical protein
MLEKPEEDAVRPRETAVRVRIEKEGRYMRQSPTMTAEVIAGAVHGAATGAMAFELTQLPLELRRALYKDLRALARVMGNSLPVGE